MASNRGIQQPAQNPEDVHLSEEEVKEVPDMTDETEFRRPIYHLENDHDYDGMRSRPQSEISMLQPSGRANLSGVQESSAGPLAESDKTGGISTAPSLTVPPGIIVRTPRGRDEEGRETPPRIFTVTNEQLRQMRSRANGSLSPKADAQVSNDVETPVQEECASLSGDTMQKCNEAGLTRRVGNITREKIPTSSAGEITLNSLLNSEIMRCNVTTNAEDGEQSVKNKGTKDTGISPPLESSKSLCSTVASQSTGALSQPNKSELTGLLTSLLLTNQNASTVDEKSLPVPKHRNIDLNNGQEIIGDNGQKKSRSSEVARSVDVSADTVSGIQGVGEVKPIIVANRTNGGDSSSKPYSTQNRSPDVNCEAKLHVLSSHTVETSPTKRQMNKDHQAIGQTRTTVNAAQIRIVLNPGTSRQVQLQDHGPAGTQNAAGQDFESARPPKMSCGPPVFVAFKIPSKQKGNAAGSSINVHNSAEVSAPKIPAGHNMPLTEDVNKDAFSVWRSLVRKSYSDTYGEDCEYSMRNQWAKMSVSQRRPFTHHVRNRLGSPGRSQTASTTATKENEADQVPLHTPPRKCHRARENQSEIKATSTSKTFQQNTQIASSQEKGVDVLRELYHQTNIDKFPTNHLVTSDNATFRKLTRSFPDVFTNPSSHIDFQFVRCLLSSSRHDVDNWMAMKTNWRESPEWLINFLVESDVRKKKRKAEIDAGLMRRIAGMKNYNQEEDDAYEHGKKYFDQGKVGIGKVIQSEGLQCNEPPDQSKHNVLDATKLVSRGVSGDNHTPPKKFGPELSQKFDNASHDRKIKEKPHYRDSYNKICAKSKIVQKLSPGQENSLKLSTNPSIQMMQSTGDSERSHTISASSTVLGAGEFLGDLDLIDDKQLWNFQCTLFPPWQRTGPFIDAIVAEKYFSDLDIEMSKREPGACINGYKGNDGSDINNSTKGSTTEECGPQRSHGTDKQDAEVSFGGSAQSNVIHSPTTVPALYSSDKFREITFAAHDQTECFKQDGLLEKRETGNNSLQSCDENAVCSNKSMTDVEGNEISIEDVRNSSVEKETIATFIESHDFRKLEDDDRIRFPDSSRAYPVIAGGTTQKGTTLVDERAVRKVATRTRANNPLDREAEESAAVTKLIELLGEPVSQTYDRIHGFDNAGRVEGVSHVLNQSLLANSPVPATHDQVDTFPCEEYATYEAGRTRQGEIQDLQRKVQPGKVLLPATTGDQWHKEYKQISDDCQQVSKCIKKTTETKVAKWHKEIEPIIELINASSSSSIDEGSQQNDAGNAAKITKSSPCASSQDNETSHPSLLASIESKTVSSYASSRLLQSKSSSSGEYVTADEIEESSPRQRPKIKAVNGLQDEPLSAPELFGDRPNSVSFHELEINPTTQISSAPGVDSSIVLSKVPVPSSSRAVKRGGRKKRRRSEPSRNSRVFQNLSDCSLSSETSSSSTSSTSPRGKGKRRKKKQKNDQRLIPRKEIQDKVKGNPKGSYASEKESSALRGEEGAYVVDEKEQGSLRIVMRRSLRKRHDGEDDVVDERFREG